MNILIIYNIECIYIIRVNTDDAARMIHSTLVNERTA